MESNVLPPPVPPMRHTTPPCCNTPYDGQSKMLHSLLYNFGQHMNHGSNGTTSSPMAMGSPPMSHYSHHHHHHHHHSYHQANTASSMTTTHVIDQPPSMGISRVAVAPPLRPRSGSVVSLGSTGSSLRDSYSPSHDSTTSPDGSLSRASPASLTSSPSPSPPATGPAPSQEGSKLFGLLKGTVASPYGGFFNSPSSRTPTWNPSQSEALIRMAAGSPAQAQAQAPVLKRPLAEDIDELPMDLSCKSKRIRSDTPPPPPPSITPVSLYSSYSSPTSPFPGNSYKDNENDNNGSILKSILCGGNGLNLVRSNSTLSSSIFNSSLSPAAAASPVHPTIEESRSPPQNSGTCHYGRRRCSTSSVSSTTSSHCATNISTTLSRVALAKKMLLPVRARVSDWMLKVVQFAKTQPEFASLPSANDKLALLAQSWARLLLLFMAETNFEFAVTPIHMGEDEDTTPMWDPESPTMQSVQAVQGFIKKCQTLNLDTNEYHFMRMAVLFHTGKFIFIFLFYASCMSHFS